MPPKAVPARYQHDYGYYKAAYRARIKLIRPWTTAQIEATLAWMWMHASAAEIQLSAHQRQNDNQNLPATNDTSIPTIPKIKTDPAPVLVAVQAPVQVAPPILAVPPVPVVSPIPVAAPVPVAVDQRADDGLQDGGEARPKVNTTIFPFWPNLSDTTDTVPVDAMEDTSGNEEEQEERRQARWLALALTYREEENLEGQWYGVHFLGEGSTGQVGLWIRVDDQKLIRERIAVRDVRVLTGEWINPINWRDQLPREIVVQRRLHARNGHDHHIHRYFSHRLAFHQKRYRMFNEVCDLGNLAGALEWYSREWRRRRNHYRWIEANPDLSEVYWDYVEGNATESDVNEQREAAWKFAYAVKGWPVEKNDGGKKRKLDSVSSSVVKKVGDKFDDLDDASDFGEWCDTDLPAKPQDVIPEAFLWRVFDQLLDAFHIMGTVGDEGPENEKWQEIVHRDVHLQNIFVKGKECAHRKAKDADASDENDSFVGYKAEDFPSIVVADFDSAFFDLQAEGDWYADNPSQYVLRGSPTAIPDTGGRYPPETYWDFAGHTADVDEKFTTKTDVWGVGQLMWNLVMNLPSKDGLLQAPFLDNEGTQGRQLVNGEPYTEQDLRSLFSGLRPYAASARYSDTLKENIRGCLHYRQADRWTIDRLKAITTVYASGNGDYGKSTANDRRVVIRVPGKINSFSVGKTYEPYEPPKKKSNRKRRQPGA